MLLYHLMFCYFETKPKSKKKKYTECFFILFVCYNVFFSSLSEYSNSKISYNTFIYFCCKNFNFIRKIQVQVVIHACTYICATECVYVCESMQVAHDDEETQSERYTKNEKKDQQHIFSHVKMKFRFFLVVSSSFACLNSFETNEKLARVKTHTHTNKRFCFCCCSITIYSNKKQTK